MINNLGKVTLNLDQSIAVAPNSEPMPVDLLLLSRIEM